MGPQTATQIRVMLVDDHEVVREGLKMLVESHPGLKVIAQAGNRMDALAIAECEQPDVILLDLDLGDESGLEFLPELAHIARSARILILTGIRDPEKHQQAMILGAMGVVQKEKAATVLLKAIEKIHAGEIWYDRSKMGGVLTGMLRAGDDKRNDPEAAKIATLTQREREIITLISHGLKNKPLAEKLFISETTVRHHLTSIFEKLGTTSRLELIIFAFQYGLAKLPTNHRQ